MGFPRMLRHPGLVPGSTLRLGGRLAPLAVPLRPGGPRTESGVTRARKRSLRHRAVVGGAEIIALVPGRTLRRVGDGAGDRVIGRDEADALIPQDRLAVIVAGTMVAVLQEILEWLGAGALDPRPQEQRGNALLDEVEVIRTGEEPLFGHRIGRQADADRVHRLCHDRAEAGTSSTGMSRLMSATIVWSGTVG
ncbi:hypothetical protein WR25_08965 [Diploscapter pachys]|uniref:Uncharacterized protein n=1 Tax=Diploscapter pachys TaxID=2018661 RepID=A0A2A2KL13_9BILA|nr:hypothetical protein WR25_08965 [Diploscapter pachys]